MANGNAHDFMIEIDPRWVHEGEEGVYGEWTVDDLPVIRARLIKLLNTTRKRERLETPTLDLCRLIVFGRDREYVERRLQQMLELVRVAQHFGFNVVFG